MINENVVVAMIMMMMREREWRWCQLLFVLV